MESAPENIGIRRRATVAVPASSSRSLAASRCSRDRSLPRRPIRRRLRLRADPDELRPPGIEAGEALEYPKTRQTVVEPAARRGAGEEEREPRDPGEGGEH